MAFPARNVAPLCVKYFPRTLFHFDAPGVVAESRKIAFPEAWAGPV
jgi:hypothetical protein